MDGKATSPKRGARRHLVVAIGTGKDAKGEPRGSEADGWGPGKGSDFEILLP